jgi:hypothetical protein
MGRMYLKAEDLQKFWNENRSECSENFLKVSTYYNYENDSKRYSGLEVSGVSRLVTVCMLEKYGSHNYSEELGKMVDTPPVWNNETAFLALENIKTGKLYRISGGYRDTTFNLYLLDAANVEGFIDKLEAPNKVGKATAKRLQQWFDYLDAVEANKAEFVRIRDERIAAFKKRLEATGLKVMWIDSNCGRIEKGMFAYKFEFYHDGNVRETWDKNYKGMTHNDLETFLSLPE